MGILKKIFGICETKKPKDPHCWTFSDGRIEIDLNRAGELSMPYRSIRLEGKGLADRILVVRDDSGKFHAYNNKCTHMGRRIDPVLGSSDIRCCSVMGSVFNAKGEIVSGPAKENLKQYMTVKQGSILSILTV
ncbi:MAG: Rieske (2Fe-2S) protein [Proteobacteria bacterium]|nr:Rieske (2Fe-2S) protein [Pseudomonadota bacterium]